MEALITVDFGHAQPAIELDLSKAIGRFPAWIPPPERPRKLISRLIQESFTLEASPMRRFLLYKFLS